MTPHCSPRSAALALMLWPRASTPARRAASPRLTIDKTEPFLPTAMSFGEAGSYVSDERALAKGELDPRPIHENKGNRQSRQGAAQRPPARSSTRSEFYPHAPRPIRRRPAPTHGLYEVNNRGRQASRRSNLNEVKPGSPTSLNDPRDGPADAGQRLPLPPRAIRWVWSGWGPGRRPKANGGPRRPRPPPIASDRGKPIVRHEFRDEFRLRDAHFPENEPEPRPLLLRENRKLRSARGKPPTVREREADPPPRHPRRAAWPLLPISRADRAICPSATKFKPGLILRFPLKPGAQNPAEFVGIGFRPRRAILVSFSFPALRGRMTTPGFRQPALASGGTLAGQARNRLSASSQERPLSARKPYRAKASIRMRRETQGGSTGVPRPTSRESAGCSTTHRVQPAPTANQHAARGTIFFPRETSFPLRACEDAGSGDRKGRRAVLRHDGFRPRPDHRKPKPTLDRVLAEREPRLPRDPTRSGRRDG